MEMGKLTAKLRDAVPVCLLVEGKEIKRCRNIEITDTIKKLEYQDFKFDVPLSGAIIFKIMFEPGILPEKWPQAQERKTRMPMTQDAQPQEAAPAEDVATEVESQKEMSPQDEVLPELVVEAFAQSLGDAQAAGDIVAAMADSEAIKAERTEGNA